MKAGREMTETEVSLTLLVNNPAFLNGYFLLEQKFYPNPEKSILKIFPIACYVMSKLAFLTPSMPGKTCNPCGPTPAFLLGGD